ncbi:ABC transporter ATP-binding protein [Paenibacillus polygoni]|uniref:ABC transporter ATP-binding protein n=1 Tax=Paenibacillus polygoni TaxID=3050112 RepID=A0ABY8X2J1_9BACL|nr:ABC transporter ATP-binding protein [Paenibacillus polygoni]WIV18219.1 ABC transporter ATP-binding protein [Paenibacillus polygoni]
MKQGGVTIRIPFRKAKEERKSTVDVAERIALEEQVDIEDEPGIVQELEQEILQEVEHEALQEADQEVIPKGPVLQVQEVHRSFETGGRAIHVLKGINMEVQPQQLVMLKGRSGSGKTTLLNMLGGLDQPTSGEIYFDGRAFHEAGDAARTRMRRQEIGFIFQAYALMPLLSAWENVELSLRMAGVPKGEWNQRVAYCLDMVGLTKRAKHRPFELSGGEQQRVAIAKAIAHRPKLLLADEPTAELDSKMGAQIMAVFQKIIATEEVSICMTTHDPTILEVADHVYEMVDGKFIT